MVFYPAAPDTPFLIAPASPGSGHAAEDVQVLKDRFNKYDAERRLTGSRSQTDGVGRVLPPMISTRFKGTWTRSPWAVPCTGEARPYSLEEEADSFPGIPRDMEELEKWRKTRIGPSGVTASQMRALRAQSGDARTNITASWAQDGSPFAAKAAASGETQLSISSGMVSSKAGSASKAAKKQNSEPAIHPSRAHAWTTSTPSGMSKDKGRSKISSSSPSRPLPTRRTSLRLEQASSLAKDTRGSLGESEEILFEQGATQMEISAPTQAAKSSPIKRTIPDPSLARGTHSEPHLSLPSPTSLPSPPSVHVLPTSHTSAVSSSKRAMVDSISPALGISPRSPHSTSKHLPSSSSGNSDAPMSPALRRLSSFPSSQPSQLGPDVTEGIDEADSVALGSSKAGESSAAGRNESPRTNSGISAISTEVDDISRFLAEENKSFEL